MQVTLDYFKNVSEDEVISLKISEQLNEMTEEEYEDFMKAWVD